MKDLIKEVPYYGGILRIIGKDKGQKITDVTSAPRRGGTSLTVRSPETIRAGQMICLRMRNPQDNSLGRYLYADQGALNAERRQWYAGQIVNWAVQVKNVAGAGPIGHQSTRSFAKGSRVPGFTFRPATGVADHVFLDQWTCLSAAFKNSG